MLCGECHLVVMLKITWYEHAFVACPSQLALVRIGTVMVGTVQGAREQQDPPELWLGKHGHTEEIRFH